MPLFYRFLLADLMTHGRYQHINGLNRDDVHMMVAGWQLNKNMWLINCFCSWKKSS